MTGDIPAPSATAGYTPAEVGEIFGKHAYTIHRRIRCGEIDAINTGTKRHPVYRVPVREIHRLLAVRVT